MRFDDEPVSDLGRLSPGAIADFARHDDERARVRSNCLFQTLYPYGGTGGYRKFSKGHRVTGAKNGEESVKKIFYGFSICFRSKTCESLVFQIVGEKIVTTKNKTLY